MIIQYRFESSPRIKTFEVKCHSITRSELIERVLKHIFHDKPPSCSLAASNVGDKITPVDVHNVIVFKRIYLNKFEPTLKPVLDTTRKPPTVIQRKRRWVERPDFDRPIAKRPRRWVENGK